MRQGLRQPVLNALHRQGDDRFRPPAALQRQKLIAQGAPRRPARIGAVHPVLKAVHRDDLGRRVSLHHRVQHRVRVEQRPQDQDIEGLILDQGVEGGRVVQTVVVEVEQLRRVADHVFARQQAEARVLAQGGLLALRSDGDQPPAVVDVRLRRDLAQHRIAHRPARRVVEGELCIRRDPQRGAERAEERPLRRHVEDGRRVQQVKGGDRQPQPGPHGRHPPGPRPDRFQQPRQVVLRPAPAAAQRPRGEDTAQDAGRRRRRGKVAIPRSPLARRGGAEDGGAKPDRVQAHPVKVQLVQGQQPGRDQQRAMQPEPLAEQARELPRHEHVDVGSDDIQPPLTARRPVDQQEDPARHQRQQESPPHGAARILQEQEGEHSRHRDHGQLLGVPRRQEQQQAGDPPPPARRALQFVDIGQRDYGQCLEHDHEQVLPEQRPDMVNVVGGQKRQAGDHGHQPLALGAVDRIADRARRHQRAQEAEQPPVPVGRAKQPDKRHSQKVKERRVVGGIERVDLGVLVRPAEPAE